MLAKRKTAIMKELEEEFADRDRLKRLRAQRKLAREKHIVIPDVSTADYERQLRKVATRGGTVCTVALCYLNLCIFILF